MASTRDSYRRRRPVQRAHPEHPRFAPVGREWPCLPGQPLTSIPSRSVELVTRFDESGHKEQSEFWLNGALVGKATWYPDGHPAQAVGMRKALRVGYQLDFHEGGAVSYAEPYVRGELHGWARQYDARGRLLLISRFQRGSGTDFWCDENGNLAEEHPLVRGQRSGCERWWNPDGTSLFAESWHLRGYRHGLAREWEEGTLRAGFPRFFIKGRRVSRRAYEAATGTHANLVPYTEEEDQPARPLPVAFVALKKRTARLASAPPRKAPRTVDQRISREPIVLGTIIAERRYQVGAELVLLQVGTPRRASWKRDFYCPFRLVGRRTRTGCAFGVDPVQALMLVFDAVRNELEKDRAPVFWDAAEKLGDVGINRRVFSGHGLDFDRQLEALIDQASLARLREIEEAARQARRRRKRG